MILRQAYKYRLKTKTADELLMRQFAGSCRFVWNMALALQKERLDAGERILSYNKLALLLPEWKQEHPFLADAPSQTLQQVLMNLDRAIKDAFDKKQPEKLFPTFKKKGIARDSFRYPQGFKVNGNRIFLPKVGWISFHKSREIEGVARNVTVSRKGSHWFVSIQTEQEVIEPVHPSASLIGIDRGVKQFAVLSDGTFFAPMNAFKKMEAKLAKEQRRLSRKKKLSKNWHKQKARITRLHIKVADMRNDYLHKTSTIISKSHAVVVLEELKVKNMSASAKGTTESPGSRVRQKSGLNKSILDQGWGTLRLMLEYKQTKQGGWVLSVNPAYTSQTCSQCGHVHPGNRKSQGEFRCLSCGFTSNADLNAAINIARAGHAQLACQANGAVMPSATGTSRLAA
ncbi:MAG: transposase [Geobacter sp.]|nr:transposase [Geobacter sp.]